MLTAGVDLAAEAKGTAIAVLEWSTHSAVLRELNTNVSDGDIVEIAHRVDKLGIDCALGWPAEFIDFLVSQQHFLPAQNAFDGGMQWRRTLAYRETDRHVHEKTGRWPLSVATDRLGVTALRCAAILSKMSHSGIAVDKTGAGLIAEVYPGAALRLWGLDTKNYRISEQKREELLQSLQYQAPWLELGEYPSQLVASCDSFDALIAALISRAVATQRYLQPSPPQGELAVTEGWIALPQGALAELVQEAA